MIILILVIQIYPMALVISSPNRSSSGSSSYSCSSSSNLIVPSDEEIDEDSIIITNPSKVPLIRKSIRLKLNLDRSDLSDASDSSIFNLDSDHDDDHQTDRLDSILHLHSHFPSTPPPASSSSQAQARAPSPQEEQDHQDQLQSNSILQTPSITLSTSFISSSSSRSFPSNSVLMSSSTSSSLLPTKLTHLYSRFKPTYNHLHLKKKPSDLYNSTSNHQLWISPENSDDESEEETTRRTGFEEHPREQEDQEEEEDRIPLSQLSHPIDSIAHPSPASDLNPPLVTPTGPRVLSSKSKARHRSSRSLRSLDRKPVPTTAPPALPPSEYSNPSPRLKNSHPHPPITAHAHQRHYHHHPPPSPPNSNHHHHPLRPARSSPNLSYTAILPPYGLSNLAAFPMPPPLPASFSPIGIVHRPVTPIQAQYLLPSQFKPYDLHTPPSSISPPSRPQKLRSPHSSISVLPKEPDDVYRRMRRRHKDELQTIQHNLPRQDSSPQTPAHIDAALYSMLNDAQRAVLCQRAIILEQNTKFHLECLAREMIQTNLQHHQQQQQQQRQVVIHRGAVGAAH